MEPIQSTVLPTQPTMISLIQLVQTNPESADHLLVRLTQLVKLQKNPRDFDEFLEAMVKVVDGIKRCQIKSEDAYNGHYILSIEEKQALLPSVDALQITAVPVTDITMSLTIHPNSQLDRAYYAADGTEASDAVYDQLDNIFKMWIAERDMLRKGQIMYQAKDGELVLSKNKEPIVVSPDKLKDEISSDQKGIVPYVSSVSQGNYTINAVNINRPLNATEELSGG